MGFKGEEIQNLPCIQVMSGGREKNNEKNKCTGGRLEVYIVNKHFKKVRSLVAGREL